jgi:hypothetical protein
MKKVILVALVFAFGCQKDNGAEKKPDNVALSGPTDKISCVTTVVEQLDKKDGSSQKLQTEIYSKLTRRITQSKTGSTVVQSEGEQDTFIFEIQGDGSRILESNFGETSKNFKESTSEKMADGMVKESGYIHEIHYARPGHQLVEKDGSKHSTITKKLNYETVTKSDGEAEYPVSLVEDGKSLPVYDYVTKYSTSGKYKVSRTVLRKPYTEEVPDKHKRTTVSSDQVCRVEML